MFLDDLCNHECVSLERRSHYGQELVRETFRLAQADVPSFGGIALHARDSGK